MPGGAPVDRPEPARADPGPRVELLDRRVRAVREHGARLDERAERVRPRDPVRPEALGEVAVGRGVTELDGGGDAELDEARQVLRREALRVLDPGPQPAPLAARRIE